MRRSERQFNEFENFVILISYVVLVGAVFFIFQPVYLDKGPAELVTTVNNAKVLIYLALYSMPVIVFYSLVNLFVRNRIIAAIVIMQIAYSAFVLLSINFMAPVMMGNAVTQGQQVAAELEKQILFVQMYAVSGLCLIIFSLIARIAKGVAFLVSLAQITASGYAYIHYLK